MAEKKSTKKENMEFQTEAKQMLHLVIHSLYSHKEIFLRELISNASDALDKLRFESLTTPDLIAKETKLKISLKIDKTAKTITISDNGIGMTRAEVINNVGTIARSGSKIFLDKLTGDQKADSNLIGQFGVGFYSAFMVASKVVLKTKRAGLSGPAIIWESDGSNNYTISETEKDSNGTEIVIYLNDENHTYAEEWQIKSLIKKYSDFIAFPIFLPDEKGKDEVINISKPIWKRSASEITTEQYEEFYKQSCGGFDKPFCTIHNRAEGIMEYSSMLFIPSGISPFEIYNNDRKHGVKLYVKRIFITDDCKELLPEYLRFIKGVVDSEDLPLNVSRETLQDNPMIKKIKKAIIGRVFSELKKIAENDPKKYRSFWTAFGAIIKEGLHSDMDNKDVLLEIARFQSSNGKEDELTSLKQYVERMRQDQKDIYYITGESRSIVEKSPHLEIFREKGIEVLYMVDPIDEFIIPNIYNFDGKQLKSITKGNLDLGDLAKEDEKESKKIASKLKKLTERIKNILTDSVKDVRVTTRLKESPSCLVADEHDMGSHMEKLMKAMGQDVGGGSKPIFEINGTHPIIDNLQKVYDTDPKSEKLDDWVKLLYDQALIAEGHMVSDPLAYSTRVNALMLKVTAE